MAAETFNMRLELLAKQRIDNAIDQHTEALSTGKLETFGDYKWNAGIVHGLKTAKTLLEEALADSQRS